MSEHLIRAIEKLKSKLLKLCSLVEDRLFRAVQALHKLDKKAAREVIDGDALVDNMEVDVEEECLKILALYQPVAIDLRFIITALKINNDLERIGDLAVNIAERCESLAQHAEDVHIPFDFETMAEKTRAMVRGSIDALIRMDVTAAHKVLLADDEIDALNRSMFEKARALLEQSPEVADDMIQFLSVSRHLERIGDHATNIAEDVIYMAQGQIVRHHPESLNG
ncbi:MAG TPA: phosphate signaling complex protein PhoU [Anaerohalosphaeraceae bacterium]|jgi:phosphate transport system protein|nr:phosphate signaling complex protein PhoU [Anaerohalosphaeraceae bacterium]